MDIAFNPLSPDIMYAITFSASGFNAYKTSTATSPAPVWTNISLPTSDMVNSILLDQLNPEIVYIGSVRGIWQSTNGGQDMASSRLHEWHAGSHGI